MRNILGLQSRRSTVLLSHHACNKTLGNHSKGHRLFRGCRREPIRRIQPARQNPPTTDGKRTATAWCQTGFQEGLPQKLSEPLVETMPHPAWMTPHLTSVMLRPTRTMIRTERMTLMTTFTTWKWWRHHPWTTNSRVPGERTAMTVPTKIRRATFEDVKPYTHTSIKLTKSQKALLTSNCS